MCFDEHDSYLDTKITEGLNLCFFFAEFDLVHHCLLRGPGIDLSGLSLFELIKP